MVVISHCFAIGCFVFPSVEEWVKRVILNAENRAHTQSTQSVCVSESGILCWIVVLIFNYLRQHIWMEDCFRFFSPLNITISTNFFFTESLLSEWVGFWEQNAASWVGYFAWLWFFCRGDLSFSLSFPSFYYWGPEFSFLVSVRFFEYGHVWIVINPFQKGKVFLIFFLFLVLWLRSSAFSRIFYYNKVAFYFTQLKLLHLLFSWFWCDLFAFPSLFHSVCMCVCVWGREREIKVWACVSKWALLLREEETWFSEHPPL